jgi:hypothetical protein
LLLFVTRTERWFFLPPFPAPPLFFAILLTQIVAVLMCGFGGAYWSGGSGPIISPGCSCSVAFG